VLLISNDYSIASKSTRMNSYNEFQLISLDLPKRLVTGSSLCSPTKNCP